MGNFQEGLIKYAVYIEELRRRFLFLTKVFIVIFAVGFFTTSPIIKFALARVNLKGVTIVTTSPFQLVDLAMSFGFFLACIVIVPVLIFNLYMFIRPGLLKEERNFFIFSIPLGLLLFLTGFFYSCGILYFATKLIALVNVGLGVSNFWDISTFISQMVVTSSFLGLLFLFPLIITFIIRLGIMSIDFLKSKRRHAIVVVFTIVSLLPPTDGLSLILMSAPLILIFELTVLFNRAKRGGRNLLT